MILFMLVYFGIYGSMHAYLFWKIHQVLQPEGLFLAAFTGFLLLMLNGPILVRILERNGQIMPATVLAWISYTWMAFLLWFWFLAVIRDLFNIGVRIAAQIAPDAYRLIIHARPALLVSLVLIALATIWGLVEARGLTVEHVTIKSGAFSSTSGPVKVAQISDIHIGLIEGQRRLEQIVAILEREKPDILLCTGDLIDGMTPHTNHLSKAFTRYDPPLGKFAVTGNHEFYAGLRGSLAFMEEAGFTVLRGTSAQAGPLRIAGVDDPAGSRTGEASYTDEAAALAMGNGSSFTILMKHQPDITTRSLGQFDLQLSGHTHKGQIFPFNFPVKLRHPYIAGLYELDSGSRIYTSRGTGTWGPPLRLLAPAEVTIFTINP
ncbi:MAG: metallophosphoesterase [bacterium]|nr:metallophosphoesterase [bacterium]MDT8395542.1 metallophosphoesterase [bacterium]